MNILGIQNPDVFKILLVEHEKNRKKKGSPKDSRKNYVTYAKYHNQAQVTYKYNGGAIMNIQRHENNTN